MYVAYVTNIKEIRKHSNADRLQICTVFGNNVIVDLNYYKGQKVIYFPCDGQLGEIFSKDNKLVRMKDENGNNCGGYLDPEKRNIKAIKLRGEQSDGLILPIECLSRYGDVSKLNEGDTISVFNGVEICKKYIPMDRSSNCKKTSNKNKEKLVQYINFEEHVDTKQLAYNQSAFKEGDICYITLKMNGSSQRTSNTIKLTKIKRNNVLKLLGFKDKEIKERTIVTGTRRTVLDSFDGEYYGSNEFRRKYHDLFKDKLPYQFEVFYEVVGYQNENTPIMGVGNNKKINDKEFVNKYGNTTTFSYGCKPGESDMYVYRMTVTTEDGYIIELPTEQVKLYCEKMGVKFVPIFDKFIFTTWEDLMERVDKYVDGTDPIGLTHIREGVVVRIDNSDSFKAYKHKNINFKILEGIIKEDATEPDIEEAEELILEEREVA